MGIRAPAIPLERIADSATTSDYLSADVDAGAAKDLLSCCT
jgi:hypothetical protein